MLSVTSCDFITLPSGSGVLQLPYRWPVCSCCPRVASLIQVNTDSMFISQLTGLVQMYWSHGHMNNWIDLYQRIIEYHLCTNMYRCIHCFFTRSWMFLDWMVYFPQYHSWSVVPRCEVEPSFPSPHLWSESDWTNQSLVTSCQRSWDSFFILFVSRTNLGKICRWKSRRSNTDVMKLRPHFFIFWFTVFLLTIFLDLAAVEVKINLCISIFLYYI